MLMYGRKKNKFVNEWMKGKMCEVTTSVQSAEKPQANNIP